jgi:hypothetical protein
VGSLSAPSNQAFTFGKKEVIKIHAKNSSQHLTRFVKGFFQQREISKNLIFTYCSLISVTPAYEGTLEVSSSEIFPKHVFPGM